jgi:hypothetical protein
VIGLPGSTRRTAVISSPVLGVFSVAAAGVLWAFCASRRRYLNTASAADYVQFLLSLLFFEFNDYSVNAVQLHVNAADVLVTCGVDREGSR